MNKIILLIIEFFKTGLFAFGGGLATIPFLNEMCRSYNWFTTDMLTTMIAVSESTPGPMGINMATYVGYTTAGILGAILATLSLVTPSIIVICIIAKMMNLFKNSKIVKAVFTGLRPAVVGFILAACMDIFSNVMFENSIQSFSILNFCLYLLLLFIMDRYKKLHPIFIICISAIFGIILGL